MEMLDDKQSNSSESSLEIIKKPHKKRFSHQSHKHQFKITTKKGKQKDLKETNYNQNFNFFILPIKNNEEILRNIQVLFQNSWASIHQNIKILHFYEIEALYYNLLKSHEKTNILKEKTNKKKWTQDEIIIFIWLLSAYSIVKNLALDHFDKIDWEQLSNLLPNTSGVKLKLKWYSLQKSKTQQGLWFKQEEDLLIEIINAKNYGNKNFKWTEIAEEFNISSTRGIIRLPKHCREKWMNYLNPDLIKGKWTLEEDLEILEKVEQIGPKWASLSKSLKGRNENSVKNRYLTLMSLHSSSRKKHKLSEMEIKQKLIQKISELRAQLDEKSEYDRVLKVRSELYLNKLTSEDCIKELSEEAMEPNKYENKINSRHVTFSEDIINNNFDNMALQNLNLICKASTRETLSKQGSSNMGSSNLFPFPEPKPFCKESMMMNKNFSEKRINFCQAQEFLNKRESSLEDNHSNASPLNQGRIDDFSKKSSFFMNNSLSKSFSKLSMSTSKKYLNAKKDENEMKSDNNSAQMPLEQKSWSLKSENQNFDSISSISKRTENNALQKEYSQTSIISLAEMKSNSRSLDKSSIAGSSFSNKENKFLMSAINNLKSEESKTSSSSSGSFDSKKHLERKNKEEEKSVKL